MAKFSMGKFSYALILPIAAALIAGCSSAPNRYGKGNDHEVVHPEDEAEKDRSEEAER